MQFALSTERLGVGVEAAKRAHEFTVADTHLLPPLAECRSVWSFLRPKASEAGARVGRTQRSTARLSNRSQARHTLRDHHAYRSSLLAFDANRVWRRIGLASVQVCAEDFHQLVLVDRAATQLEIHKDVVGDGCGLLQRLDVV